MYHVLLGAIITTAYTPRFCPAADRNHNIIGNAFAAYVLGKRRILKILLNCTTVPSLEPELRAQWFSWNRIFDRFKLAFFRYNYRPGGPGFQRLRERYRENKKLLHDGNNDNWDDGE